jgi:hypothetical protein
VEDVRALLAAGNLSEELLDRWLEPADRELLETEISISGWYDIGSYTRMNEMLRQLVGHEGDDYLQDLGRKTARRLLDAGFQSQLEYVQNTQLRRASTPEERFAAFGRDLRRLSTISASILNFSVWTVRPDELEDRRYVIEVSEAADFPEVPCWRSAGFVNEMACTHGDPNLWTWAREAPDRVVFRMVRPV